MQLLAGGVCIIDSSVVCFIGVRSMCFPDHKLNPLAILAPTAMLCLRSSTWIGFNKGMGLQTIHRGQVAVTGKPWIRGSGHTILVLTPGSGSSPSSTCGKKCSDGNGSMPKTRGRVISSRCTGQVEGWMARPHNLEDSKSLASMTAFHIHSRRGGSKGISTEDASIKCNPKIAALQNPGKRQTGLAIAQGNRLCIEKAHLIRVLDLYGKEGPHNRIAC